MALNQAILDRVGSFQGLYDPSQEHDACGVGFVAGIDGERSHQILQAALRCVRALSHRGAMDADAKTGDGAGVQTQLPYDLFRGEIEKMGQRLFSDDDLAVGFLFLPKDNAYEQAFCRKVVEETLLKRKLCLFGWRKVPVRMEVLGDKALATCPHMEQALIGKPADSRMGAEEYEQLLYLCRSEIEYRVAQGGIKNFYVPSFSSRTIVYKGLLVSPQLDKFYLDLRNPDYKTALAVYHQRYSTNTFPTWPLAQPFRFLGHNGEINTVQGNRIWMRAREARMEWPFWGKDVEFLRPVIQPGGSDSASLDNTLELLCMSGRDLLHSIMMLVPAAWRADAKITPEKKAFYEYHACVTEPWDGPAALVLSDGRTVAACLDRNGLRPARYVVTRGGLVFLGSEVGVAAFDDKDVVEKGRLAPGEILAVDTVAKKLWHNDEIKAHYASRQPYGQWLKESLKELRTEPALGEAEAEPLPPRQLAFGYNEEEIKVILKPMAETGEEAIGSMGDDTPLAVLSLKPRLLYTYFKQLFAQVTNPPIDPIREKLVMSLEIHCGRSGNLLDQAPGHADCLRLQSPVLSGAELEELRSRPEPSLRAKTLSCLFPVGADAEQNVRAFAHRLQELREEAEKAADADVALLILSDRGVSAGQAALPMLLCVSAIHHHLIRKGKRMQLSLVAETGECRDVHQFACLIGFGASAVHPYLAAATYRDLLAQGQLNVDAAAAWKNYRAAIEKGLLKIMSKMGISTLESYHGAQVFQAIGIDRAVAAEYFSGVSTPLSGIGLKEIAQETLARHHAGFAEENPKLADAGYYRFRRDGEAHAVTPQVIQNLHTFSGIKGADKAGKLEDYRKYVEAVLETQPLDLRHCLSIKPGTPIPLEEVEPVEEIRKRFTTAGMSLGALSPEAHETLAVAMNRIGGKSNSGEGGEDRERFIPLDNGDSKNSAIKQIASGRFGVTAEYLASAAEIEIKMAQGSKPGEGGQIPGHKVSALIARLRHSTPGVMLISPPPHHDIYSIEDLAQLIYDLKQVNPRAKICVKLVAEAGVGTIAAGVAKAHADVILISGHDGGTGASPLSSIKNCGAPWEMGVSEAQQVLLWNGLRNRVTLRTDGGMRTGFDIVVAALLGAEEYNFGTVALIAAGCVYVRQCHLNNCPVGVATQDEKLRAKFKGSPENVIRFFDAVAQEVREIMAGMGVRTMNELIGHAEWLEQRNIPGHPKANTLDLKSLIAVPPVHETVPRHHTWDTNTKLEDRPLDNDILQAARSALQNRRPLKLRYKVTNVNRSVGTQLSGAIAYATGMHHLPEGTIEIALSGSAGQSLGAFLVPGIRLLLSGEANDYVGKGMSGGEIALKPHSRHGFAPHENSICGNTVLYGATGGLLFANGRAGERFAVRNSGATAVVEGIGDHGCEYMTRGTVVVLGPTGKNFGAGMSGGVAYVWDPAGAFETLYNPAIVGIERLEKGGEADALRALVERHQKATGSTHAAGLLAEWEAARAAFWKVVPHPTVSTAAPVPAKAALSEGKPAEPAATP
ncbi:MAG: glutamate synthase large subunit [Verrucomicrobium sp.]|nr:glutamate synthase large subunit [Verrucomicrobium sp.]